MELLCYATNIDTYNVGEQPSPFFLCAPEKKSLFFFLDLEILDISSESRARSVLHIQGSHY